jgi:L-ascorbate metabolism protein UlaG (beta-lactamase superfamily)
MRLRLVAVILALGLLSLGPRSPAMASPRPVAYLTWYGQSCFLLESATGTKILMDPIPLSLGYTPPADLAVQAITISHDHPDHNHVSLVQAKAKVIRGITPDKKGWLRINERIRDITIRSVGVYHDQKKGAEHGLATVFVFEVGGVRVAHLGDLGHPLTDQQLSAIGSVDVVLLPVGGGGAMDAQTATYVADQIRPRLLIIPMHYKTKVSTMKDLAPIDAFIAGRPNVRRTNEVRLPLTGLRQKPSAEVVLLPYYK